MKSEQALVPKLRFGEFKNSDSCKRVIFNDLFLFSSGKNIKQNEASPNFATPCVRYGELYHMYAEVITKTINYTNLDESELRFSDGDEILLPSAGEDPLDIGSASALPLKGIAIGRTINVLKPKDPNKYDQIFISYYINQKSRKRISQLARGASISNVYNSDLKSLTINIPPLHEQEKIAAFLTSVDDRIDQLKRKKSLLQDYKKGVMQKLFSQELRFKDENGNDYPKWEDSTIGEVGSFYYGKSAPKFSLSDDAPTPCVRYGELYSTYGIIIDSVRSKTNIPPTNLKFSKGGEVLVPRVGEDPKEFSKCCLLPHANVAIGEMISVYNTDQNPLFYTYYFRTLTREFARVVEGGNVSNLYFRYLEPIKIGVPSNPEQSKIANFLSTLDQKIEQIDTQITQTQTFKKGLLQQMFV